MNQCETSDSKISSAPATPPNTLNRPSTLNIGSATTTKRATTPPPTPLSERALQLAKLFAPLKKEEDVMSSKERMGRADRTPIPHGTNIPPAGMEIDSDEDNDDGEK